MSDIRKFTPNQVQWELFPTRIMPQKKSLVKAVIAVSAIAAASGIYLAKYFTNSLEDPTPYKAIFAAFFFFLACAGLTATIYRWMTGRLKLPVFAANKDGLLKSTFNGYDFIPWRHLKKAQITEQRIKGSTLRYVVFVWDDNLSPQISKRLKKKFELLVDSKEQQQQVVQAILQNYPQALTASSPHA